MKENVGRTDRIVRAIVGSSLLAASATHVRKHPILSLLGTVAGVLVTETAVTRVCPVYTVLGLDSRTTPEKLRDFRTEINEESNRITETYSKPIVIDETRSQS